MNIPIHIRIDRNAMGVEGDGMQWMNGIRWKYRLNHDEWIKEMILLIDVG